MFIAQVLYLILPLIGAGLGLSLASRRNWLPSLNKPLDAQRQLKGQPWLGLNKTWRGVFIMTSVTTWAVTVQAIAAMKGFNFGFFDYASINPIKLGLVLSLGYLLAELPNSFIKRQAGLESGQYSVRRGAFQYFFDQADSAIGVAIALVVFYHIPSAVAIAIIATGTTVHFLFDQVMYALRLKRWPSTDPPLAGYKAATNQLLIWVILSLLLRVVFRGKVQNKVKLMPGDNNRYIMAANHQSGIDPFMITAAFQPRTILRLLPFRYITANIHLYRLRYGWLLRAMGGFPSHSSTRETHGLGRAKSIIEKANTLCIFPEGQRSLPHEIEAKRGVQILARETGAFIIPLHIHWHRQSSFNRRVFITIGDPFDARDMTAQQILDRIYALPLEKVQEKQPGRNWYKKVIKAFR